MNKKLITCIMIIIPLLAGCSNSNQTSQDSTASTQKISAYKTNLSAINEIRQSICDQVKLINVDMSAAEITESRMKVIDSLNAIVPLVSNDEQSLALLNDGMLLKTGVDIIFTEITNPTGPKDPTIDPQEIFSSYCTNF